MGSIFSLIIVIPASIIGAYFINQMLQDISFFGLTSKQQFLLSARKRKNLLKDSAEIPAVTNPEIKD